MPSHCRWITRLTLTLAGVLLFSAGPRVLAEEAPGRIIPPACWPPVPPCPPSAERPPAQPPSAPAPAPADPVIAPGLAAAVGGRGGFTAPNMIGNLLGAGRSVSFFINRAQGAVFVNAFGATSITNVKIGDNNSPVPRDRVSLRYNRFENALSVTGISDAAPFFDPSLGPAVRRQALQTREYDVHMYTLSVEKTFFDQLLSLEARLPFSRTLATQLDLNVGRIQQIDQTRVTDQSGVVFRGFINPQTGQMTTIVGNAPIPRGFVPLNGYTVARTPELSRGRSGNELGNLELILKGVMYEQPDLVLTGGFGMGIPTAGDTRVRVTDYLGGRTSIFAEVQRVREFNIKNETWALSPFLAVLATPTDRLFTQSFLQLDLPINDSNYTFSSTFPGIAGRTPAQLGLTPVFTSGRLREQTLLHVDVGAGWWVLRNPSSRWITGWAPTVELHYTTALDDAEVVQLPNDGSQRRTGGGGSAPAPGAELGNLRNRVDILDVTLGSTLEFARRATLATALALPLRKSGDRTFDWEFQVQFNYYFGGERPAARGTPNF